MAPPVAARGPSESDFLETQSAHASAEMARALREMKDTLVRMTHLQSCADKHPWITTGSALAVGLLAGALLPRSPRSAVVRGDPRSGTAPQSQDTTPRTRGEKPAVLLTAGKFLAGVLFTLTQGLITTLLVSKEHPPAGDASPLAPAEDGVLGPGGERDMTATS